MPAMRVCMVLFYNYSIVHCLSLIRNRSILSLIFSGKVFISHFCGEVAHDEGLE